MDRRTDGRMDGRMECRMDGLTDGLTDGNYPRVLQDTVPFGAAGQKYDPIRNLISNHKEKAERRRDDATDFSASLLRGSILNLGQKSHKQECH